MAMKLKNMSWNELKGEMSIAGSPDKMIEIGKAMLELMEQADKTNAAELINLELVLKRLSAEAQLWQRHYEGKTNQKISGK